MKLLRSMLTALVVVLAITGVALLWLYHPGPSAPWEWLRVVHRVASRATELVALVYLVAVLVRSADRWRWPHAAGLLVLAVAFGITGFLLPWDQLALWAVTVGTKLRGPLAVFSHDVKFVLVDGVEVGRGTYLRWLGVHTALLPAVGVAGWWAVRWRVGSRRHAPDVGSPSVRRDHALARHGDPQPDA